MKTVDKRIEDIVKHGLTSMICSWKGCTFEFVLKSGRRFVMSIQELLL
jgi:hypothetical protein